MVKESPLKGATSSIIYLWPANCIIALRETFFFLFFSFFFYPLPPTFQKHASRWIDDAKLPQGVNVCVRMVSCNVLASYSECFVLLRSQYSRDRLRIRRYHVPDPVYWRCMNESVYLFNVWLLQNPYSATFSWPSSLTTLQHSLFSVCDVL